MKHNAKSLFTSLKMIGNDPSQSEIHINLRNSGAISILEHGWENCVNDGSCSSNVDIGGGYRINYGLLTLQETIHEYAVEIKTGDILPESDFGTITEAHGPHYVSILPQKNRLCPVYTTTNDYFPTHNHYKCHVCQGFKKQGKDGTILTQNGRKWDFFFETPPLLKEGQLVLAPDVTVIENEREQQLTLEDCTDLVDIARGLEDLCVAFDSPYAGATVDHIHFDAWIQKEDLPVQRFEDYEEYTWEADGITASIKYSYPAFCLTLKGGSVDQMGSSLYNLVRACQILDIPHNVLARNEEIFLFLRKEDAPTEIITQYAPTVRLGASHLAGHWLLDNESQLERLTSMRMGCALRSTRLNWYKGLLLIDRVLGGSTALREKKKNDLLAKKRQEEDKP